MYNEQEYVLAGGLMTYATSIPDLYRRAATYVIRSSRAQNPPTCPWSSRSTEFIINLKTAKQIGLTIPPNVLARADRVVR